MWSLLAIKLRANVVESLAEAPPGSLPWGDGPMPFAMFRELVANFLQDHLGTDDDYEDRWHGTHGLGWKVRVLN